MLQHEPLINSVTVIALAIKFTKSTFAISITSPRILYVIVNISVNVNNIPQKRMPNADDRFVCHHTTGQGYLILTFSISHVNKIGYILYRISVRNIALFFTHTSYPLILNIKSFSDNLSAKVRKKVILYNKRKCSIRLPPLTTLLSAAILRLICRPS